MYYIVSCEGRGQIFKPCGGSCIYTCDDILSQHPLVCLPYCKPGCECPIGQVRLDYQWVIIYCSIKNTEYIYQIVTKVYLATTTTGIIPRLLNLICN